MTARLPDHVPAASSPTPAVTAARTLAAALDQLVGLAAPQLDRALASLPAPAALAAALRPPAPTDNQSLNHPAPAPPDSPPPPPPSRPHPSPRAADFDAQSIRPTGGQRRATAHDQLPTPALADPWGTAPAEREAGLRVGARPQMTAAPSPPATMPPGPRA